MKKIILLIVLALMNIVAQEIPATFSGTLEVSGGVVSENLEDTLISL